MTTTPPTPTVVVRTTPPTPRVEVTISPVPADAVTWTVWRNVSGQRAAVRGAYKALASGGFAIDYEVPFGAPVTYTVETADVNGVPSSLSSASSPVTVTVTDSLWLSDPLNPTTAIEVDLLGGGDNPVLLNLSLRSITYGKAGELLPVIGSRLPVGILGTRLAPSGADFTIYTATQTDGDALRELLYQAAPLLARTPDVMGFYNGAAYLAPDDVEERPYFTGESVWSFATSQVAAPTANVAVYPRVWTDVLDEAATWTALQSRYTTWAGVLRGQPGTT